MGRDAHAVFLFSSEADEVSFWDTLGKFLYPCRSLFSSVSGNNNNSVCLEGWSKNEMRESLKSLSTVT